MAETSLESRRVIATISVWIHTYLQHLICACVVHRFCHELIPLPHLTDEARPDGVVPQVGLVAKRVADSFWGAEAIDPEERHVADVAWAVDPDVHAINRLRVSERLSLQRDRPIRDGGAAETPGTGIQAA